MAFPVPDHLPRKTMPKDISTEILTKVSEVTTKTLTSSLVTSWVDELEAGVKNTKTRIHERITSELPEFERQLQSSKSVQARLVDLTSNVSELSQALHDPQTGLLPSLLKTLTEHSNLSQDTLNTQIYLDVLENLSRIRDRYTAVSSSANSGDLTEAASGCARLLADLQDVPPALLNARIMNDVKRDIRSLRDRVQEQLSDAYGRSVRISLTELTICHTVKVRSTETTISLQQVMSSLSSDSLEMHLATLRRDIVAKFIELPLQQPMSSSVDFVSESDGNPSCVLRLIPSTPTPKHYVLRHLQSLFTFLKEYFISDLPPSHREIFPRTLCKPTIQAILQHCIHPGLPSSLSELPFFLDFLDDTVQFEEDYIINLLGDNSRGEPEIKRWAAGVAAHYGRKRRVDILCGARELILSDITNAATRGERVHQVEMEIAEAREESSGTHWEGMPNVVPVQGDVEESAESSWDFENETKEVDHGSSDVSGKLESSVELSESAQDGWGLDDEVVEADDSAWDFDDSPKEDPHHEVGANGNKDQSPKSPDLPPPPIMDDANNDDASAAWGWDEEEENLPGLEENDGPAVSTSDHNRNGHAEGSNSDDGSKGDSSSWDDPWAEQENEATVAKLPSTSEAKQPKLAKRLEKFTKAKSKAAGTKDVLSSNDSPSSSPTTNQTTFSPTNSILPSSSTLPSIEVPRPSTSTRSLREPSQSSKRRPPDLPIPRKVKRKETYLISELSKDLIRIAKETVSEGRATASSNIIVQRTAPSSSTSPAQLILQSVPLIFDLYRAVYPVAAKSLLSQDQARAMRFSNDCIYLSEQINNIDVQDLPVPGVVDQLHEVSERLRTLGDWWYDENIERQCAAVHSILGKAEGFVDTGVPDRYDECETAMTETLHSIRSVAHQWKVTLGRTKYYSAVGHLVNFALATVVNAVLALPDIPEVDSQRLGELSRILNALEGLFVEDHQKASLVVSYVPTWLKYSYLSELLEASIADISYLFDEGALIDFEVEELISLVKALFADTQLRTNTIEKLERGHPVVQ